ncbi:MAG: NAD(P)/FAD-dependent oxidoreductase [Nocardioides sp.]|nr:NAD(P)/FAD-dependent oxidoreductase [Nocardioides sp.]
MHRDYEFLIIGGGMTAHAAAKGVREQGSTGSIGIVGEERTEPFPRPALSKKLWTDPDFSRDEAALDTVGETGAALHLGSRVVSVDTTARRVSTVDGDTFGYDQLLLATGGHPRRIDGLDPSDRVFYFRTVEDYDRLRALAAAEPAVVVVGGGYIGSEIACALVTHGCDVTVVHPDEILGQAHFPLDLATTYESLFTGAGVRVEGRLRVTSGSQDPAGVALHLSDGSTLEAPVVVVGLGIRPAGDLLDETASRSEDGGIVVDEHLRTSVPHVYAAGDVAEYLDPILGRTRVEHADNATTMGAAAGRIMAGSQETYRHTPCFYSDVFDIGYEAIGTLDPNLEIIEDPVEDDGMVLYYLDQERVRGVLMWNCDGGVDAARELLAANDRPRNAADLVGSVRG